MAFEPTTEPLGDQHWAKLMLQIADERSTEAFSALYDHFAPRLKSYLIGRGANDAQADELLQSCLLQVWESAGRYDPKLANVATWIYRIARNRYFDQLRKQQVRDKHANVLQEPIETTLVEPDQQSEQLQRALRTLPSKQAQVLYMSFYQSLSHREIAEQLEIPLGSVKSSLRLAMEKLRGCMEAQS